MAVLLCVVADRTDRWVNGTVGTIDRLANDRIDGLVYPLERETWDEIVYTYDQDTQKVEARVTSYFTNTRFAWTGR